jgi:hypothetical protein
MSRPHIGRRGRRGARPAQPAKTTFFARGAQPAETKLMSAEAPEATFANNLRYERQEQEGCEDHYVNGCQHDVCPPGHEGDR